MNESTITAVLKTYGIENGHIEKFGNGLIHHTWKVSAPRHKYILQRIHDGVFKTPRDIAHNIRLIADYLSIHSPGYFFVKPVKTLEGHDLVHLDKDGFFRLMPFVSGSHALDVVQSPDQAYQAATQFGRFTKLLARFNAKQLRNTIPDFHNLSFRYQQLQDAKENASEKRLARANAVLVQLEMQSELVKIYNGIALDLAFRLRVTHHDTKISNVLFDNNDKAICVIDLDTMMPGYFISDVGDMMRTYLSPVNEEEKDFDKIMVRTDFYHAIVTGYLEEMKDELSSKESQFFFYSGQFMIYMQALRFLTDYLNNDHYYGAAYEGHNLVRAENQLVLLQRLMAERDHLNVSN